MIKEKLSHLWAALCLFTRLPFWRIWDVPAESYRYASHHWIEAGALAAAIVGGIAFIGCYELVPTPLCVLMAIVLNLLLTGAFHEDGLADFFDGFGGGRDRESILRIMKDSHIGTYGVIALILYFMLTAYCMTQWIESLFRVPHTELVIWMIYVMQAIWARFLASFIVAALPYARAAEEAKIKTTYALWRWYNGLYIMLLAGCAYILFQWLLPYPLPVMEIWLIAPVVTLFVLYWKMSTTLRGYTGDCCGATVLLCELTMNVTLCIWFYMLGIA